VKVERSGRKWRCVVRRGSGITGENKLRINKEVKCGCEEQKKTGVRKEGKVVNKDSESAV
jgi:hypothetical protein